MEKKTAQHCDSQELPAPDPSPQWRRATSWADGATQLFPGEISAAFQRKPGSANLPTSGVRPVEPRGEPPRPPLLSCADSAAVRKTEQNNLSPSRVTLTEVHVWICFFFFFLQLNFFRIRNSGVFYVPVFQINGVIEPSRDFCGKTGWCAVISCEFDTDSSRLGETAEARRCVCMCRSVSSVSQTSNRLVGLMMQMLPRRLGSFIWLKCSRTVID